MNILLSVEAFEALKRKAYEMGEGSGRIVTVTEVVRQAIEEMLISGRTEKK